MLCRRHMRSLVQERLEDHEDQDRDQEQKESDQVQEEPEKKQQTDPKLEAARLRLGEAPLKGTISRERFFKDKKVNQ